ncbi:putative ribonuclease H-like domain-containing protein [Tanacetum coccineum]|uniref:Ribonuclease H-like domain-containing protein n=1 Tax=Tanacetum coccineum TaxID=301880 RepID=A0ABQ5HM68_9ASTR
MMVFVNWENNLKPLGEEETNLALMAINSNNEGPPKPEISDSKMTHLMRILPVKSNDCEDLLEIPRATLLKQRKAELKKHKVFFNTGNGVAKLVWNNENRVNHANHFVPRPVQLIAVRQNVNFVRPNVNTGRANVNSVRSNVNTGSFNINTGRSKQPDHPLKNMEDRGIFDSGCSGHMTGNKDHLDDFEECKGGSVTFLEQAQRFSWVFFLATKDETSGILQNFIRQIENQLNHRVKIIRSDNGTEFKNRDMLEFCGNKGIKQEYSNARTPQQNGVAERMNRTLIEAARTMLADSLLPTTFWAEAVNTACYIFNRVRVTKPQNKTPYELLFGHKPMISYIRPFGCHVTILDTLSVLGKFDGKSDEGFLVGYSLNSKAYRVYNLVTKRVEVNLHVNFLEEKPNVKGVRYRWMFDIDYLTDSMNYIPVSLENQANSNAGTSAVTNHAGTLEVTNSAGTPNTNASGEEDEAQEFIIVPTTVHHTTTKVGTRKPSTNSKEEECLIELQNLQTQEDKASTTGISEEAPNILAFRKELDEIAQKHLGAALENVATSTSTVNTGSEPVNTGKHDYDDSDMPELEIFHRPTHGIFNEASYDDEGVIIDFNNLPTEVAVRLIPTLRIHNIHPQSQILGDPKSAVQTRSKVQKQSRAHALISYVQRQQRNNHIDQQHCLFAWFLSQEEPKKILEALNNESWVEAMQEELLQFKLQQVWVLVDLPHGAKAGISVATSTTEAEYVAAASCCGQVLWIQNQMLDYGFNFMNTKIHIDNESTICIVKNPVYHSKTKHIEIKHHFIRDSYEKKLIKVEKIHTDFNVADLFTKAFDGPRLNFLVVNIGMINP